MFCNGIFCITECPKPCSWWYPNDLENRNETVCYNDYDTGFGNCYDISPDSIFTDPDSCIKDGGVVCRPLSGIFNKESRPLRVKFIVFYFNANRSHLNYL